MVAAPNQLRCCMSADAVMLVSLFDSFFKSCLPTEAVHTQELVGGDLKTRLLKEKSGSHIEFLYVRLTMYR